jgi:hypothetical protein
LVSFHLLDFGQQVWRLHGLDERIFDSRLDQLALLRRDEAGVVLGMDLAPHPGLARRPLILIFF